MPDKPDAPLIPDIPERPDLPDNPETPESPDIPANPDTPDIPDIPAAPDIPDKPRNTLTIGAEPEPEANMNGTENATVNAITKNKIIFFVIYIY